MAELSAQHRTVHGRDLFLHRVPSAARKHGVFRPFESRSRPLETKYCVSEPNACSHKWHQTIKGTSFIAMADIHHLAAHEGQQPATAARREKKDETAAWKKIKRLFNE